MGSISDFLEEELLDHIFNAAYAPPGTVYLGLSTADPGDDAAGLAEPVGGGYGRIAITFGAAAAGWTREGSGHRSSSKQRQICPSSILPRKARSRR